MKPSSFKLKHLGRIWPNYPQGKRFTMIEWKFTIDFSLNLKLPLVELAHKNKCSSKSTYSSILNLLHTNTYVCDFKIPLKDFRSPSVVNLLQ